MIMIYSSLFIYVVSALVSSNIIEKVTPSMKLSNYHHRVIRTLPLIPIANTIFVLGGLKAIIKARIEAKRVIRSTGEIVNKIIKDVHTPEADKLRKVIKKSRKWWSI
jgi:hypothetical protein